MQNTAVVVLKAAIPLFQQLNHKLVAIAGGGGVPIKRQVAAQMASTSARRRVGQTCGGCINQNKFVGMTSDLKRLGGKGARVHRTVDQGIQING